MSTTKKLKINVTRKDAEHGVCTEPQKCMVARAIQRRLKPGLSVSVGSSSFDISDETGVSRVVNQKLPEYVRKAIITFDRELPVEPFSFPVELPVEVLK